MDRITMAALSHEGIAFCSEQGSNKIVPIATASRSGFVGVTVFLLTYAFGELEFFPHAWDHRS